MNSSKQLGCVNSKAGDLLISASSSAGPLLKFSKLTATDSVRSVMRNEKNSHFTRLEFVKKACTLPVLSEG